MATFTANTVPVECILEQPQPQRNYRATILLLLVLALSAVVIVRGINKGEFNYNVDETQHAVTGLYVADLLKDLPLSHPVQYTYVYYAQYPALAGVLHWPPLFYLFEGVSFLILGRTVIAARLAILLFAMVGLFFWFRLVKELQDEWTAGLSAALLALSPSILLFEKTVMLEIPALALCIAATYFWTKYLLSGDKSFLYWFAIFVSAAMLTKQNSVYLGLFCLLTILLLRKWRLAVNMNMVRALAIISMLVGPFYMAVYLVHWRTIAMDLTDERMSGLRGALFYWKTLPNQLGWILFAVSVLGLITSRMWDKRGTTVVMLSWIASCYIVFTLIGLKEARYVLVWVPPFSYFAAGVLTYPFRVRWMRLAVRTAAILLLVTSVSAGWFYQRPTVSGYAAVASRVTQLSSSGVVLYDGDLPGNFIFFMRAHDPERHFVVLRKALYAYQLKQRGGSTELVHSREELEALLRGYGIRFIAVSDFSPLKFRIQRDLRDLLHTSQFRLVEKFPIRSSEANQQDENLLLYENLNWGAPTERFLRIRMLTLAHDIVVPMDQLVAGSK